MGILAWIVLGLIAGWLAGQFMGGSGYGLVPIDDPAAGPDSIDTLLRQSLAASAARRSAPPRPRERSRRRWCQAAPPGQCTPTSRLNRCHSICWGTGAR